MLIKGNYNENRINILAEKYANLVSQGVECGEILTIVLNSCKKSRLTDKICAVNPDLRAKIQNIYTFFGLCYNAFNDNKDFISELIKTSGRLNDKVNPSQIAKNIITPNLCGLEVSQFIFKQSIKEADFSDYVSKINLLHQLFRRYSLIVQNCLTNEEVRKKSASAGETFCADAQKAIDDYKLKTIKYESFDYLRQLAVFPHIYKETDYFKDIKYLIIDDADEFSYAFWKFVEFLLPQLKDYYIAFDDLGSSRCGYLCAFKSGVHEFIKKHSPEVIKLENNPVFTKEADEFYRKIKSGEKFNLNTFEYKTFVKRLDMIKSGIDYAGELIKRGTKPEDIAVITPVFDEILLHCIKISGLNFQILSGNEKLIQNKTVKHIITILKLCNNISLKEYELKDLFINLFKIPYKRFSKIINDYFQIHSLPQNYMFEEENYNFRYKKLLAVINSLSKSKNTLSNQIQIIYENLIKEFDNNSDKEKIEFLIKEAKSFETAFQEDLINPEEEFILQIENTVISENPAEAFTRSRNSIIVSSPQKIIDYSINTKYQLWFDISSNEWIKQDTGTLYNSWVLSRDWNKNEYTLEDNISLTRDKAARVIRKLILCAKEKIVFYSSLYDNTGNENFSGLDEFIKSEQINKQEFKIIPRDDQKAVLEYKKGKMGILAVPGAGKTTILMALVIKLINDGVKPENIFVLTYMESAARNFKEKIKSAVSENTDIPNISTIHGLALRIIKEHGNYNKTGADENFEICDDITKEKITKELFYKLKIEDDKYDNFLRCLSIVKLSGAKSEELHSKYKEINEFYIFFKEYNKYLKQNNLIDYDDMLCSALRILEENPEILQYYQNLCRYIIEDEAQDSTEIQQKLISLLSGKYNNFIRCGDINQSITSTFTNSDVTGFRDFINKNKRVEMVSSQRCAKPIYSLANSLINQTIIKDETKNAFYKTEIKGTTKNPQSKNAVKYNIFNTDKEEKKFIIQQIKELMQNEPKSSIAVLLRLNSQVNEYNEMFLKEGIKTSIRTDCLSQKNIYKIIAAILNIIQNPLNNNLILNLGQIYKQNEINNFSEEDFTYLKSLKSPFIKLTTDEITSESLLQLYWDIDYWLNNSTQNIYSLALDIGLYYSRNNTDKSNSFMISTLIKKLTSDTETFEDSIKKLDYAAQKPLSAYKFFEDENSKTDISSINIMTMHKSKGDEFDYVFIPELNEENYPLEIKNVKLKSGAHFVQTIKKSVENIEIKPPEKLKQEQTDETLRLLYVGITRAKKGLIISASQQTLRNKHIKISEFIIKLLQSAT